MLLVRNLNRIPRFIIRMSDYYPAYQPSPSSIVPSSLTLSSLTIPPDLHSPTTIYQQGYDDGISEGYREGHYHGRQEGYEEGQREGIQKGMLWGMAWALTMSMIWIGVRSAPRVSIR